MAAAGTLNRPASAQGTYGVFQTYYAPTSPPLPPGSFSRPSSAGGNYSAPNYANHRTSSLVRPVSHRHATSTQYIPTTTGVDAPTRIYGLRTTLTQSSEDIRHSTRQPVSLHRNYTAPDLRAAATKGPLRIPSRSQSDGETMPRDYDAVVPTRTADDSTRKAILTDAIEKTNIMSAKTLDSRASIARGPVVEDKKTSIANPGLMLSNHQSAQSSNLANPRSQIGTMAPAPQNTKTRPLQVEQSLSPNVPESVPDAAASEITEAPILHQSMQDTVKSVAGLPSSPMETPPRQDSQRPSTGHSEAESQVSLREALTTERPRAQTPVPSNYTTPEKSRSLKDRLRRALSMSSNTSFSEPQTLQGRPQAAPARPAATSKNDADAYSRFNRSTDNMSISSTASSASVMLRKLGHGLSKKTKRSFSGIFSGSSKSKERSSSMATQSEFLPPRPSTSSVSYVNAEPELQSDALSTRASTPSHGRMPSSVSSVRIASPARTEITEAVSDVDGHGSVSFPRLSEEITVEDDRSRRASMHLERPLPIDLDERNSPARSSETSPASGRRRASAPIISTTTGHINTYTGRGILKRTFDPLAHRSTQTDGDPSSIIVADMGDFDISFAPTPMLVLDNFGGNESTTAMTPPRRLSVPVSSANPSVLSSPHTPAALKFSPRVTIHDTYTALEYDRRGEIATCNRLTPLLAQRIKEELNAYKMDEMDVAEDSKRHTHFFS